MAARPRAVPVQTSSLGLERYLLSRSLLSSAGLGWSHLLVRTFVEPRRNEYLFVPGTPDPFVVLITRGANRVECREGGRWQTAQHRPGHVAVTAPGNATEMRWWSESEEACETLHLHLDAGLFRREASEAGGLDPARVELVESLAAIDPVIEAIGLSLMQELQSGNPGGRLYADEAAGFLAVHLLRRHCTTTHRIPEPRHSLPPGRLRRVLAYIRENLAGAIGLDELAAQVGLSRYHFARVFKASTGETPHQYVLRLRIEEARRLLVETKQGVMEIAQAVGFRSPSHFAALFKRSTGMSPAGYRALIG